MKRRQFLAGVAATSTVGVAGCTTGDDLKGITQLQVSAAESENGAIASVEFSAERWGTHQMTATLLAADSGIAYAFIAFDSDDSYTQHYWTLPPEMGEKRTSEVEITEDATLLLGAYIDGDLYLDHFTNWQSLKQGQDEQDVPAGGEHEA